MQEVGQLAYKVEPDEDDAARIVCSVTEEGSLYPEEVSAHVLLRLIDAVQKETGCEVDRAVISVPAYFDEGQQEATIAAGASTVPSACAHQACMDTPFIHSTDHNSMCCR